VFEPKKKPLTVSSVAAGDTKIFEVHRVRASPIHQIYL
jgi:hypothetical protein